MKKIILFTLFTLLYSMNTCGYPWIKTAIYQNNAWSSWHSGSGVIRYGSWDLFQAYDKVSQDINNFYFRVTIDNFYIPNKKTRKAHIDNDEWYEYTGYIEYWIDDDHMNFLSTLNNNFPIKANPRVKIGNRPSVVKKVPAKIQIQPYRKYPELYNIWFEGIGFAFYFYDTGY